MMDFLSEVRSAEGMRSNAMIETYWNHLPDVRAMYPEELEALILSLGEKKFRAKQLFEWLHKKKAASFQDICSV